MQVLWRSAILLCAIWLAPNQSFAGNPLRNGELIEKSGVAAALKAFEADFKPGRPEGAPTNEKLEKAWADFAAKAFNIEKILTSIDQGLEQLSPEDKALLLAHYNSPLGRRIVELEAKASQPEAQSEIDALAEHSGRDPATDADRTAVYGEIVATVDAVPLAVPLNNAVQMLLSPLLFNGMKEMDADSIAAMNDERRSATAKQHARAMACMAYTYHDLATPELQAYLTFLRAPASRTFNVIVGSVMFQAFVPRSNMGKP
jgi:hypothetical protein